MKKRNILLVLISSIAATSCVVCGVSTYALFAATDKATQGVSPTAGEMKKSIFLDCEEAWGDFNPSYCMHSYNKTNSLWGWWEENFIPVKNVEYTISGTGTQTGKRTLYVFEFDTNVYSKFIFARINPEYSANPSFSTGDPDVCWGQTYNLVYSSSYNYYYISGHYSGLHFSIKKGKIDKTGTVRNLTGEQHANEDS